MKGFFELRKKSAMEKIAITCCYEIAYFNTVDRCFGSAKQSFSAELYLNPVGTYLTKVHRTR